MSHYKHEVRIKPTDNGYILEQYEAGAFLSAMVFEEKEKLSTEEQELEDNSNFRSLLYQLLDLIGPQRNSWGKHQIYINLLPGDEIVEVEE